MIRLREVSLDYGGRRVLSGVSLDLQQGDFYFLTGPSGAGKTTLLNLCHGALRPSAGTVELFGSDLAGMDSDARAAVRRRLGLIHQEAEFLDHMSLADNVLLPLTVRGQVGPETREQRDDLLDWVGLEHRRDARPASLSGGERQRAVLARALLTAPEAVLADEPTGNLDWDMSIRLLTLLIELHKLGTPVMMATHDLSLIRASRTMVNARVLRLKDGQLTQAGAAL